MKRPPFKADGRGVVLQYVSPRTGRTTTLCMRGALATGRWLQAIVSGDAGERARVRLASPVGRPWHVIEATLDEAREHLLRDALSARRVPRLERRRVDSR